MSRALFFHDINVSKMEKKAQRIEVGKKEENYGDVSGGNCAGPSGRQTFDCAKAIEHTFRHNAGATALELAVQCTRIRRCVPCAVFLGFGSV